MDEMVNASEGQSTFVPEPSSPSPSESHTTSSGSEGKLFTQSEIDNIVKKVKHEAVEGYKRKASSDSASRTPDSIPQNQPSTGQHYAFSPEEVRRMAAEETQRLRDEWYQDAHRKSQVQDAQRIVNEFLGKMAQGKEKYQDFDDVVGNVEFGSFPNVVQLLNSYIDNTHDVMYELGNDRTKLAMLEQLVHMSPNDAIHQVKRLSQSIKEREAAGKTRFANEPLSQLRPSNTGTSNGALSVSDYKKKYRI